MITDFFSPLQSSGHYKFLRSALPLALIFASCAVTGCSGVTHRGVDAKDPKVSGIPYYDTSPYVFVRTDNQGGLTSEFVYLPDKSKKRQARPYAFLGTVKGKLTWTPDGTKLTNSEGEADSTTVPKAIIGVLEEVAKEAAKSAMFDGDGHPVVVQPEQTTYAPAAYLFKVVKVEGVWGLEGASTHEPRYKSAP